MYSERIGYLGYKLYRLGWQNALYGDRVSPKHVLLSAFHCYRQGFVNGVQWSKEHRPQEKLFF